MTYEQIVAKMKEAYEGVDASNIGEHIAYQFNITGEGEGIFYLEVVDGTVKVEPYDYYDNDATIIASADVLVQIAKGELGAVEAFLQGKLQVERSLEKAARLQEIQIRPLQFETAEEAAVEETVEATEPVVETVVEETVEEPVEEAKAPVAPASKPSHSNKKKRGKRR